MGANSIRVDFVWQHIEEDGDNQFKWDELRLPRAGCEKRDIRIFALIGYQWPPNWFPDDVVHEASARRRCGRHLAHEPLAVGHHQLRASRGPRAVRRVVHQRLRAIQELQGDRRLDHRQRVRLPRPVERPAGRL